MIYMADDDTSKTNITLQLPWNFLIMGQKNPVYLSIYFPLNLLHLQHQVMEALTCRVKLCARTADNCCRHGS